MSSCEDEEIDELMGDDDLNAELRKQMQSRESVIPTAVRSPTPTPFLQEQHGDEVESVERLMQQSNKETQHDETQMPSYSGSCGSTDMNSQYHLLQEQYDQQRRIIEVLEQANIQLQKENEDLKSDNDRLKLELTEGRSQGCSKST